MKYDSVCHSQLVIDTLEVYDDIYEIPLNDYPYESFLKYIRFVKTYSIGNYNIDDFILGNYIGDHEYVEEVLNKITKKDISGELCELIINTNKVKKYKNYILK